MVVATVLADTISGDIKFLPSIVEEFLRRFDSEVELFRDSREEMELVQYRLDRMSSLVEVIKI